MNKKQVVSFILIAFFVGAIGSIVIGRFVIPYLSTFEGLRGLNKFATNSQIVINRREEVQLNEGVNIIDLIKQASNMTVSVYNGTPGNYKFSGNGIIVSSDGLIFTVRQAVAAGSNVMVLLNDGSAYPAVVGPADPKSDLVVLKIEASNLSVAQFDEARSLQAGQRVIGIGPSSKEFSRKFTTGFVTKTVANTASLERVFLSRAFEETIDTDAVIVTEFYGGPVINLNGRVIGMMSSGNSHLLPAENLQTALTSYLQNNQIIRPHLGVRYLSLSKSLAALRGLPQSGALVLQVESGSPALQAGLAVNDYIVEVNGQRLEDNTFEYLLNRQSIGEMKVKVLRGTEEIELTVNLKAL